MATSSPGNSRSVIRLLFQETHAYRWMTRRCAWRAIRQWRLAGHPTPPPHAVKRALLKRLQRRFRASTLVETGTYYGDMISDLRGEFGRVVSIEWNDRLHSLACKRMRPYQNVRVLHGDSAILVPKVLESIDSTSMFWLDAHYSGPGTTKGTLCTPVFAELSAILGHHTSHVILIDDARCFVGEDDYPRLSEVEDLVRSSKRYVIEVADDIIRVIPVEIRDDGYERQ